MSRFVNKTYGRNASQQTAASKAFDDILTTDGKPSSSKASSTIKRWGGASFTSTRGSSPAELGSRKRKLPDDDEFGDDIFSFDSDDEGPSKPMQGMGYKVPVANSQKSSAVRKKPADGYSSVKKKASDYPAIDAEDDVVSKSKPHVRSKVPVVNSVQSSAAKRSTQLSSYAFHSDDDDDADMNEAPLKLKQSEAPSKLKQSTGYGSLANSQKARTLKKTAQVSYAFDSDDEGPSKPPQGMGYKLPVTNAQKTSSRKKNANEKSEDIFRRVESSTSAKLRTYASSKTCVSNGPETDITHESEPVRKVKPTVKSYSRNNKVSSSRSGAKSAATTYSGLGPKQMPIETYMKAVPKQSVTSASSKLLKADTTATAVTRNSQTTNKRNKKFFTSQSNTMEDHNYFSSSNDQQTDPPPQVPAYEDHNYSQGIGSTGGSNAGSTSDGDFDFYFNIEEEPQSGDPEIIFNSPQKREREAALRRDRKLGLKADSTKIRELSGRDSPFGFDKSSNCDSSEKALSTKDSDTDSLCSEHSSQGSTSRNGSSSRFLKKYHRSKKGDDDDDTNSLKAGSTGSSGAGSDYRLLDRKRTLDPDRTTKTKKPLIRRLLTSPRKGEQKATYNVRQWHAPEEDQSSNAEPSQKSTSQSESQSTCPEPVKIPPRLRRVTKCPRKEEPDLVTALKVGREHKGLFTVVQRVKQAHECQEHGETQEFEDDIDYIMDGLDNTQPVSVRCLSSINLATKCTTSGFRMHLRAHGTVSQIFSALNDAPDDPDLALCTAAVMFMLSRDRLNMDLDQSTLQLMVRLLSADNNSEISSSNSITSSSKEFDKIKEKVQGIVEILKKESGATCVELEDISTGHLAMETLLSLTSTLAGDWFKEELRILGGLDHIVNTIHECVEELDECIIDLTQSMIDRFRKIGRCLRVLENVTYLSPDNQNHLLCYKSSLLVNSLCRCLKICENVMPFNEVEILIDKRIDKECPGYTVFTCLLYLLRVLLNLTHDNEFGSTQVGQQERLVKTVLICVLRVPQFVPPSERFDLQVLGLGLLTNMVENCDSNRRILVESHTVCPYEASALDRRRTNVEALEALTLLFNARLEAARFAEYEHDEELEAREKEKQQRRQRRICGVDNNSSSMEVDDPRERSGMWKESDSGLEWVVLTSDANPDSQETDEDSQEKKDREVDKQIAQMDAHESDDDLKVEVVGPEEDENFMKALHKAGKHMEDSIVAAYVALLIGCVIQHNEELVDRVRDCLSEGSFESMIRMLKKFLGFMNFTAAGTIKGGKSIRRIIEILEAY